MSELNVTPLVDVVLVLLIIFMVTTPMLTRGRDMTLPLAPLTPDREAYDEQPEPFVLSFTWDRRLFFDKEPEMEAAALPSRLRAAMHEQPSRRILLRADSSLQVGDVRTVLHSIRAAGARRVTLSVNGYDRR